MFNYMCSVCMFVDESVKQHTDNEYYCPSCMPLTDRQKDRRELGKIRLENKQLRAENARLKAALADAKEEYNEEHAAACAMFEVISSIAAMVGIENSSPEISRKTIDGVKRLRTENARLNQALVEATERAQEAEYNLHLVTKRADAFHAENAQLRERLQKYQIVTVARLCTDSDRDCDGDGSGPGCENPVMWEIQAMDDSGSHYAYVCADHLSDYQKWAHDDGRLPMVFELEDDNG